MLNCLKFFLAEFGSKTSLPELNWNQHRLYRRSANSEETQRLGYMSLNHGSSTCRWVVGSKLERFLRSAKTFAHTCLEDVSARALVLLRIVSPRRALLPCIRKYNLSCQNGLNNTSGKLFPAHLVKILPKQETQTL